MDLTLIGRVNHRLCHHTIERKTRDDRIIGISFGSCHNLDNPFLIALKESVAEFLRLKILLHNFCLPESRIKKTVSISYCN